MPSHSSGKLVIESEVPGSPFEKILEFASSRRKRALQRVADGLLAVHSSAGEGLEVHRYGWR